MYFSLIISFGKVSMSGLRAVVKRVYVGDRPELSRAAADKILTSNLIVLQSYFLRSQLLQPLSDLSIRSRINTITDILGFIIWH
jgi:hypothetical protein